LQPIAKIVEFYLKISKNLYKYGTCIGLRPVPERHLKRPRLTPASQKVICVGEVLWDVLPEGRYPGGAPLNVAYHLRRLGISSWVLSAVGDDAPGKALLRQIEDWGVGIDLVARDPQLPTGSVRVCLTDGIPEYTIAEDVAWDRLPVPGTLPPRFENTDAIVFGSLAQRRADNLQRLLTLLDACPSALRVFDVNLRPPYDDRAVLRQLAERADFIKLNDEEAAFLLETSTAAGDLELAAREIAESTATDRVCITAGASGAGLLSAGDWRWVDGQPVAVKDTVGAGDSFLAALIKGMLLQPDRVQENLETAARLAAFVASRDGATPRYEVMPDGSVRATA